MASSRQFLLLLSLSLLVTFSVSTRLILPETAILPVSRDPSSHQYVTRIYMGDLLAPVKLVLDLGGPFIWADCRFDSSYRPVKCRSLQCLMARPDGCTKDGGLGISSCTLRPGNVISGMGASGHLAEGRFAVGLTDGVVYSGPILSSNHFLFTCASNMLLKGLVDGAKGMLGLGNSRISLPSQLARHFGLNRRFAMCLSQSDGAIFFGETAFLSNLVMLYTPLVAKQDDYLINVKSMRIGGKRLSFDQKEMVGEARISTTVPYTVMESKIYDIFVKAYVIAAVSMNLTMVKPVEPFGVCFSAEGIMENKETGPNVPSIDLVLQSEMVKWTIYGRNSMVKFCGNTMCLGVLDGGLNTKDSMVIGGHQLEDHLLEFNLENSMLGFSSSLLMGQKSCSDFKISSFPRESS